VNDKSAATRPKKTKLLETSFAGWPGAGPIKASAKMAKQKKRHTGGEGVCMRGSQHKRHQQGDEAKADTVGYTQNLGEKKMVNRCVALKKKEEKKARGERRDECKEVTPLRMSFVVHG